VKELLRKYAHAACIKIYKYCLQVSLRAPSLWLAGFKTILNIPRISNTVCIHMRVVCIRKEFHVAGSDILSWNLKLKKTHVRKIILRSIKILRSEITYILTYVLPYINSGLQHTRRWWRCQIRISCIHHAATNTFNLLAPEFFFLILAHSVYKTWIIQEPNKLELWNKLHFEEEKKRRVNTMFKIFGTYICWINI